MAGRESEGAISTLISSYDTLYDLVEQEMKGLTDGQLDWRSDKWEWSKWSIRRNLSHIANTFFKVIILHYGDQLWPKGDAPNISDLAAIAPSLEHRYLDEQKYWKLGDILQKVREGIELVQTVLLQEPVESLQQKKTTGQSYPYLQMLYEEAPPTSMIRITGKSDIFEFTLEATITLMYYETITHIYNVQRLKRAQGLRSVTDLPRVGFWVLSGWDRSEAD